MSRKFVLEAPPGHEFVAGGQAVQEHLQQQRALEAASHFWVNCANCGHRFTVEIGTAKMCAKCKTEMSVQMGQDGKIFVNGKQYR